MLLNEHATYTNDKPCPYAKFICWLTDEEDRIALTTYAANGTTQEECDQEFAPAIDTGDTTGSQVTLTNDEHVLFLKIRQDAVKIIRAVFESAWITVENKKSESQTSQRLKKTAIDMLEREKTEAAAMEIDAEASADPKVIRELIAEGVKKATETLQKEVNKLQQTVQRSNNSAKNPKRGASSSQPSASSKNKKGIGQKTGEKKGKDKKQGNGKKETKANPRPPSPRKQKQPRGTSPDRSDTASHGETKKPKKQQTGGPRQQQKKGPKKPIKPRSS
jgi:hypothetical protein